jgi:hypothetical protein
MMCEKTVMYGGDDLDLPLDDRLNVIYYAGLYRKINRLKELTKKVIAGCEDAKAELLDTYIDVVGYGLLAINNTIEELQNES